MAPRAHRVEPDDDHVLRPELRLDGLPLALELRPRAGEARGEGVGDVVVPGGHEKRPPEPAQIGGSPLVLAAPAAVREIPRHDDQLGPDALDQRRQSALDVCFLRASGVQVRDVEEPHGQRRTHAIH